jgi:ABC-type uncharacterized transport system permease subunit
MKWIAPIAAYLAVGLGLFQFHSAWGALLGFHFAIIFSLFVARPNIPVKILFQSNNINWIIFSILICGSSGTALYFLWENFGFANDLSVQVESLGLNASNWVTFIAYFALVNPFIEEYFWRGYLGSTTKGLYVSDFVYSGFHALILMGKVRLGMILLALTMLSLAGWIWRQVARENDSLLASVLGHMAADFTILMAVYWNF